MVSNDGKSPSMSAELNYHIYAQKADVLALHVGRAVALWANLEGSFINAAADAMNMSMEKMSSLVGAFKSFSLTLDFVDRVVKLSLDGRGEVRRWNSIIEYARELSADRNHIAHQGIVAHGRGHPAEADWADAVPKVGPTIISHYLGNLKREPMDAGEVAEISQDIQHCVEALIDFYVALRTYGPLPQRLYEPVVRRRPPIHTRRGKDP